MPGAKRGGWRPFAAAALATSAVLAGSACAAGVTKMIEPIDPSLRAAVLTRDDGDRFSLSMAGGSVTVSAAVANTGGNSRFVFWRPADLPRAEAQSCSTWSAETAIVNQEGEALRIVTSAGDTRVLIADKNILGPKYFFNLMTWDTATNKAVLLDQVDLGSVFGPNPDRPVAFPWRMCMRAVANTVSFKVWPASHAEPAWGDPAYGASVNLPSGWQASGQAGWYVGHLGPGDSATFTNLTTGPPGPMA